MNRIDLDFVADIVRTRSGLELTPDKGYLVESRLSPVARREGFDSLEAMLAGLRARNDERLAWAITEAMAANETFFFRDRTPFERLRSEIIPALVAQRRAGETLRIWCAACSSGQEAYSLAIVLDEMRAELGGLAAEIVATDISAKALDKARSGLFSQFEVQRGLPIRLLLKYFEKSQDQWRIDPRLAASISFKRFNLLDDMGGLGRFDVVFCRNVLVYFEQDAKVSILRRIAAQCRGDAFLILGASETIVGLSDDFAPIPEKPGLYQRAYAAAAAA